MDNIAIFGMICLSAIFVIGLFTLGLVAIANAGEYMDVHKEEKTKKSE